MPDVGQWRTPRLTVTPFDGTTSASVTVIAPSGATTSIAATTPDGGNTWIATASYEFTAEGVWVEQWTVTGAGKGKAYEYEIVVGAAQPVQLPTALASIGHLTARLGRQLTADEKAKAPAMLADASTLLRDYTRRNFTSLANETVILRPVGNKIRLPHKPVLAVDQVEMVGVSGTPNRVMAISEWEFDGIDEITVWRSPPDLWAYGVPPTANYANTYKVTLDSGGTVPPFIVTRVCRMVLRTLLAPTQVQGLVQERIGQYAYQYGQFPGGGAPGPVVEITDEDEKALAKAGYRSRAGTIQLRM